MPMRFGVSSEPLVRSHQDNAVMLLWTGAGKHSIASVGLTQSGSALVIPEDTTLLLMGTTSELDGELQRIKQGGITAFVTRTPSDTDSRLLSAVAARKWTADGGGLGVQHKVSVIALHSRFVTFEGGWRDILSRGLRSDRVAVDDLIAELPRIKQF